MKLQIKTLILINKFNILKGENKMGYSVKFIHTADIHLGSLFTIGTEQVDNYVNCAFEKIIDYAIAEQVDFILISGDLYDKDNKSLKANKFFTEQCLRLLEKDINIYMVTGNHDARANEKEIFKLPENIFICDSELGSMFEVKNSENAVIARIFGQSYRGKEEGRKLYTSYNPSDEAVLNIGMLHTALEGNNFRYVPCTLENLKEKSKISYWALGHIHQYKIVNESSPLVVYPGIPQGRDIGEEGQGGCVLVKYNENNNFNIKFLPCAAVVWKQINININTAAQKVPENITELINLIKAKAIELLESKALNNENILEGYAVRWIVQGESIVKDILDESEEDIEELIRVELNDALMCYKPYIYTDSLDLIIDKPHASIEELKENNKTFQEIYDICLNCKIDNEFKSSLISSFGQVYDRNFDRENLNYLKLPLEEESFNAILKKAEGLIVNSFLEGSK